MLFPDSFTAADWPAPPLIVNPVVPPIAPLNVMLPPPLPIEDAVVPKVIDPAYVTAVAVLLVKAPALLIPVPLRVKAFVPDTVVPFRSSTAPEATVTEPAPSAVPFATFKVPAVTVVPPV